MRVLAIGVACWFALVGFSAQAAEDVQYAPPASWVESFEPTEETGLDPSLPVHVLYTDYQALLELDKQAIYTAFSIEILNAQGLSAGNLSLPWSAENQEIIIHHVRIRRGDEVIDVLEDEGQVFTVLRREQSLEQATLTGILTANMFPAGLEVGDHLEIAYTIVTDHPVHEGHAEAVFGPFNSPVGSVRVRLNWPEELPLRLNDWTGLPELQTGTQRGIEYAEFLMEGQAPLSLPEGAPGRFGLVRMLEVSDFANWGELAEVFVPLYQDAAIIPESGRLRDELEEIRAATDDPVRRTELALELVQERVRYVALAMGTGGLIPASAETTWARRFGDCKAKTALLLALLHELGIEAEPIAVHSLIGDALPQMLPRIGNFDHILVRAHVNGSTYFLDGTRTGDRSLDRLAVPYFDWGLPIIAEGAELVRMLPEPMSRPGFEMIADFDLSAGIHAPAAARLEVIYRDDQAVGANASMTQLAGDEREQAIEGFWRDWFDYVTAENVSMEYAEDDGELRLTLTGTAVLDWDYSTFEPGGMRLGYTPDFTRADGPNSDAPMAVAYPFFNRRSYRLTLPEGFTEEQIDGDVVAETVAGIEYIREMSLTDNIFSASRSTRSVENEFPYSDIGRVEDRLLALRELRLRLRIPDNYVVSDEEAAQMGLADGSDVADLLRQGFLLQTSNQYEAAERVYGRAIELDPGDEWAFANRAIVRTWLGMFDGAERDVERSLAIDPANYVAFHARGMVAAERGDPEAAIQAYSAALASNPESTFALERRAGAHWEVERFDEALLDAQRWQALSPANPSAIYMEAYALDRLGRRDEAVGRLESTLLQNPGNDVLRAAISELFFILGLEDRSEEILGQTASGQPDPTILVTRAGRRNSDETELKLSELTQALEIEPGFVPALLMRADTYWMEFELEAGLADADRAIELAPQFVPAYQMRVKILLDTDEYELAAETLEEMINAVPVNASTLAMAAGEFFQMDYNARAVELAEQAYEIDSETELVRQIYNMVTGQNIPEGEGAIVFVPVD